MAAPELDRLPGFRRRFIITPAIDWVSCAVEDDYHSHERHDPPCRRGSRSRSSRCWNAHPGRPAQAPSPSSSRPSRAWRSTPSRRGASKSANCTHLHDLAVLVAAHAQDAQPLTYDILVSDPLDGRRHAELRRDGEAVLGWIHEKRGDLWNRRTSPGLRSTGCGPGSDSLEPALRELAKLLRWGTLFGEWPDHPDGPPIRRVAHAGRQLLQLPAPYRRRRPPHRRDPGLQHRGCTAVRPEQPR